MKTRIDQTNKNTIERLKKEGRGSGMNESYRPWLKVQDVPSLGRSVRIQGWKTGGRVVHLLSNLELHFFYSLEWDSKVVDYNEQYPLDQTMTLEIAEEYKIPHPAARPRGESKRDPGSDDTDEEESSSLKPIIMTTDFYVSMQEGDKIHHKAYAIKPERKIYGDSCGRTRRKLKLEALYWHSAGVPFKVITERKINKVLAKNVEAVHAYYDLDYFESLTKEMSDQADEWLLPKLLDRKRSLSEVAAAGDKELAFPAGACLTIAKHLIARRRWAVDFSRPFIPCRPLHFENSELSS